MAAVFTNIVYKNYSEIDTGIKILFWVTALISILPLLLYQLGVDFASHQEMFPFDRIHEMSESAILDAHFFRLSGAFVHTILECSAFIVAFFTVVLCFTHYSIIGRTAR